jgi:hypothetical protein
LQTGTSLSSFLGKQQSNNRKGDAYKPERANKDEEVASNKLPFLAMLAILWL